jgi:cytoskeletal protein RodZ
LSVGETLAAARAERGLTVEDVSTATRIRAGLIRAIEADDFAGCGGAVYARGHIRSIARVVGIDAEPLVAEFDREHSGEPAPALVPAPALDPDAAARAERHRPNWTAAMAAALVAIIVLAAVGLASRPSHHHTSAKGGGTGPQASAPASVAPSAPPSLTAQLPNDAIALVRVTSSQTWMSVTTLSGRLLFQGLLQAGQRKVFRDAHGLRLVIGNAPAVDLVANGRDIGSPKAQGNVARITIQRGSDVQYA